MAYLLICGSDQSKYGSITKGFVSQYSLGNDQYPKTIQMATNVLSNHKIDAKYYENQKRNKECNTNQQEEEATPAATSFAQKDDMCYVCGKPGHTKPECPDETKIPWAKWAVNKAIGAMQATKDSDDDENTDNDSDNESVKSEASTSSRSARQSKSNRKGKSGWNIFQRPVKVDVSQMVHNQSKKGNSELDESLKNVILLDTGSSIGATFLNPDMVTDVKMSNQPRVRVRIFGPDIIAALLW